MKNEILDEPKQRNLSKKEIQTKQMIAYFNVLGLLVLFTILFGVMLKST